MDPEQKARLRIDQQLEQAGWIVQDYREMFIAAGLGVAVRESSLLTGEADYLLYVDGQIIGVIEAKPEGHTLTGVETQSAKYIDGLPPDLPCWRRPLAFAYESTGAVTQFTNTLDPDPRSREVFTFHRPAELLRLVELEAQLRLTLRSLPELNAKRLWRVQIDAVANLEKSLAQNRPRALIQMATGSGKIIREEFGRGNDFCQKITYRTGYMLVTRKVTDDDGNECETAVWEKVANLKPEDVLTEFRNSYNPRIAVTVDMISTGTDVKPLECLLFMRNIASSNYYEQMKGRGVRVIDADTLQQVTPDAKCKNRFVIIDAVGVTESCKSDSQPLDRQPSAPLKKVLETVAKGVVDADLAATLAARLARLDQGLDETAKQRIKELSGGKDLPALCRDLVTAIEPQAVKGKYAKLADLIALVRHVIDPTAPLVPFGATVDERYHDWLAQQQSAGVAFSADQRRWLDAIKDHIAASLSIEQDDFDYAPFAQLGGLGRAYDLFGERLPAILEELNERLAA